jgi:16S rRNA G966 N2-methylase RsmD
MQAKQKAEEAREKAEKAAEELRVAKASQKQADEQAKQARLAEEQRKAAETQLDKANRDLEKANEAAKNSSINVGAKVVESIIARNQAKEREKEQKELLLKESTERTVLMDYMDQFKATMSFWNMTYDSYLSAINQTGVGVGTVKLILVDPPYDMNFVTKSKAAGIGKLIDKVAAPGCTAVIFMNWRQASAYKHMFINAPSSSWVIEDVQAIHRHGSYAYRSGNGHKKMTEFVMIAHKRNALAVDANMQNGIKNPRLQELESIFGSAPSGSWRHDYLDKCAPVPSGW